MESIIEETHARLMVDLKDLFTHTASCPICRRRVFDVTNIPDIPVSVRIKCPHCRNIVGIPIAAPQRK